MPTLLSYMSSLALPCMFTTLSHHAALRAHTYRPLNYTSWGLHVTAEASEVGTGKGSPILNSSTECFRAINIAGSIDPASVAYGACTYVRACTTAIVHIERTREWKPNIFKFRGNFFQRDGSNFSKVAHRLLLFLPLKRFFYSLLS